MRSLSTIAVAALSITAAIASPSCATVKGMLSCEETVPACLQSCLDTYGLCSSCHLHRRDVQSCINNVCGHPPLGQRAHAHIYFDSLCAAAGYRSSRGPVALADQCSLTDYERGVVAQQEVVERGDGEARRASRALVWQG